MKEKHVILRALQVSPGGGFLGAAGPLGGPTAVVDPTGLAVEVDDIEGGRLPAIAKNRDVLAVAPVIPMKLIDPVPSPQAQPAAGVEWGVKAVRADSSPFTGAGIVVAVLDTGIDNTHPAFAGVTLVEKNFTAEASGSDQHGHGTHCAGTVFGRDVDGTRIGVARGVQKALIGKVLGSGGGMSDQIVQAIHWAITEGAHVISMSLGMDFPGFQKQLEGLGLPPELATSRALEGYRLNVLLFERFAATVKALSSMVQPGLLVAAAGNESRRDLDPDFKIAVSPPAVADGFVSVAALGQAAAGLEPASFSNTNVMVAAPGVAINSAKRGGGLTTMSGTSMATPHVAGVAALWAEKLKASAQLTAGLLTARLVASGTTAGLAAGFDPADVGSGLVQAPQS